MASEAGSRYLFDLQAALAWNRSPTSVIRGRDGKKWTPYDYALLKAYQILDAERCQQCGRFRFECQSESSDVQYQFEIETCSSTAAREKYEDKRDAERNRGKKKGSESKPPAGEAVRPVPYRISGKPLSDLREGFYEQRAKRMQALIDARPKVSPTRN